MARPKGENVEVMLFEEAEGGRAYDPWFKRGIEGRGLTNVEEDGEGGEKKRGGGNDMKLCDPEEGSCWDDRMVPGGRLESMSSGDRGWKASAGNIMALIVCT